MFFGEFVDWWHGDYWVVDSVRLGHWWRARQFVGGVRQRAAAAVVRAAWEACDDIGPSGWWLPAADVSRLRCVRWSVLLREYGTAVGEDGRAAVVLGATERAALYVMAEKMTLLHDASGLTVLDFGYMEKAGVQYV